MNPVQQLVTSWLNPTALFFIVNLMLVTIFILKSTQHKQPSTINNDDNNIHENHHHHQQHGPTAEVLRVPSFFERVKSFSYLSRNQPMEPEHAGPAAKPRRESPVEEKHHVDDHLIADDEHYHEGITGGGGKHEMITNSTHKVLKKSESEKAAAAEVEMVERRRPETARERAVASDDNDEAVDAKADDFINRFRQQLKMQRLDSILRYREMLNRGV